MMKVLQQVVSSLNKSYNDESFVSQASRPAELSVLSLFLAYFELMITGRHVTNLVQYSRLPIASLLHRFQTVQGDKQV